jgi:flagellin-like protein
MKTLRKIRKSTKALSPVVASIILIAVTVAVSIAVAAWMGALTVGFMGTEELKITNVQFSGADGIAITVKNTGSTSATVSEVYVNNGNDLLTGDGSDVTVDPNSQATITVTQEWDAGSAYQIRVVTTKGNPFVFQATGPS